MEATSTEQRALAVAFFLLGIVVDFLFNAIFKIIWIVIYGLCYIAIGTTLNAYLSKTRFAKCTRFTLIALLLGALAGHLAMTGHQVIRNYSMRRVPSPFENAPVALNTKELVETLYVTSDKLLQKMGPYSDSSSQEPVPVVIRLTTEYGCIQKITVDQIAGVDIASDPAASWTWRSDRYAIPAPNIKNMGWGDEGYFWCSKQD